MFSFPRKDFEEKGLYFGLKNLYDPLQDFFVFFRFILCYFNGFVE